MQEKNYIEKIRKLLALSKSSNENEAKAALLKAQKLMAQHKITMEQLEEPRNKQVKQVKTDITFSKRKNPWILQLSSIIARNYCCENYMNSSKGKQTRYIGFVGFEEDVEICIIIFKYAVDCILSEIKHIEHENSIYCRRIINALCNSYGYGYVDGISEAFQKQQDEMQDEWGLVMSTPKDVTDVISTFKSVSFHSRAENLISEDMYKTGYHDGTEFDPTKRVS